MQVRFRLNQVCAEHGLTRHGRIQEISSATGIERHVVSQLLDDAKAKISLTALAEICRFLIDRYDVDPRRLPGILFALEPSRFLSMLRQHRSLRTCFGVRRRRQGNPDVPWAAGADSFLHGKILELLLRPDLPDADETADSEAAPRPDRGAPPPERERLAHSEIRRFHQEQVHATNGPLPDDAAEFAEELASLHADADRVDRILHQPVIGAQSDSAAQAVRQAVLMLGSVKSNPVCELATARLFGAVPWGTHGRRESDPQVQGSEGKPVADPRERAVPIYLRYRDIPESPMRDAFIPSCYAGLQLASGKVRCGKNSTVPGTYFETEGGDWDCVPSSESEDAAIILYNRDRQLENVEVVLGGFSSLATFTLAMKLEQIVEQLQPVPYETPERAMGAYVIRFKYAKPDRGSRGEAQLPELARAPEVIPLSRSVLERRLEVAPSTAGR